jgi:hypothetical protein
MAVKCLVVQAHGDIEIFEVNEWSVQVHSRPSNRFDVQVTCPFSVTFRWYLNCGENRPKVGLFYIENNFVFKNYLAKSDNRRSVKPTFRVLYASPNIILTRFTKHVLFCLKWFSPGSSIIDSEDSDYQLPPTPPPPNPVRNDPRAASLLRLFSSHIIHI